MRNEFYNSSEISIVDWGGFMQKTTFSIAIMLSLSSCVNSPSDVIQVKYAKGSAYISEQTIAEIKKEVPQNLSLFASQISEKIQKQIQQEQPLLYQQYRKNYFAAWDDPLKIVASPLKNFYTHLFFHENNRAYSLGRRKQLINNVKQASIINKKAIVIRDSLVKEFPTNSMFFSNLKNPGDHYPFDTNIRSRIRVGVPLRALALSQDKLWCFVSCYFFSGWIYVSDIAYVDDKFIKKYKSLPLSICIKEKTTLDNQQGFTNSAEIGTILPQKGNKVLCPAKCSNGYAELISCPSLHFKKMPLKFTSAHVHDIAKQFLGQEYGWGGYLGHRDCSMLTMDFFSVFGIYLPRNGHHQLHFGRNIKLTRTNKKKQIFTNGIPWLTLAGKPGHVMIYVGQYKGEPVFFHNVYALRTMSNPADRIVIGETCLMGNFQSPFFDSVPVLDSLTDMCNVVKSSIR